MKITDKDIEHNKNGNTAEEYNQVINNKYTLDFITIWINSADTKVSVFTGIIVAVFTIFTFIVERNLMSESNEILGWQKLLIIAIIVLSGILAIISIFFNILAISPRFLGKKEKKCSLFYEDIRKFKNPDEYIRSARNITSELYNGEVLLEIYYNAKICSKKLHRFKVGLWIGFSSIILVIIASIIIVVM